MNPRSHIYCKWKNKLQTKINIFSGTQLFFIGFGILAQLSFVETIKNYLKTGNWGYPRFGWTITNQIISIGWFDISSNSIITYHLMASYGLYLGLLLQICIMMFLKDSKNKLYIHKSLGFILVFIVLPIFLCFSLALDIFLIKNLTNKILMGIIPIMIFCSIVKSVLSIQYGNKNAHVDGIFTVLILLNAASVFRLLIGVLFIAGVPVEILFANNEPNHIAAIARTLLVIAILTISFHSCNRLKQNRFTIISLTIALFYTIIAL
jgi:hypothetical protein